MGVVYLASAAGSVAAVKTIHPQLLGDGDFRRRFEREAAAARSVRSPRVAELLDADLESNPAFLAFAYIDGPTLTGRIAKHGPLVGAELIAFAAALADGLAAIHDVGVTHRDIKPANLICTPDGPVVIDFGVASVAEGTSLTATGLTIGSVGWMAPEQATGRQIGPACDIFSWAATVAYAASGEPPFGTGRADAVIYRILHDAPAVPDLPAPLAGLVEAALSKEPAGRPSASQIRDALVVDAPSEAGADDQVTQLLRRSWTMPMEVAGDLTMLEPVHRPARRRAAAALAAAAAVVALVVGVLLTSGGDPGDGSAALAADTDATDVRDSSTTEAPLAPSTTTATASSNTTTAPLSVRAVDWMNRTYELDCSGETTEQVTLVDGHWSRTGDPTYGSVDGVDVIYMDMTPDPGEEAVVSVACAFGANTVLTHTFVYRPIGDDVAQVGTTIFGYPVLPSEFSDDAVDVYNPIYLEGSPRCCPDAYEQETWGYRNGTLTPVMTRTIDVEEVPFPEFED